MKEFCNKHKNQKLFVGLCYRCGGNGYTDHDLEEMDNPIAWHNDGNCWQCRGTGNGSLECPLCEEEAQYQYEIEQDREANS